MLGLTLIERMADPELITQMSTAEKTAAALQVTALGMGVTFCVLILLWALIGIMAKLLNKPVEKKNPLAPAVTNVASPAPVATPVVSSETDEELVAVITAAIAASLQRPLQDIIVRNIMRTPQRSLAWANVAKQEQLDSRRF